VHGGGKTGVTVERNFSVSNRALALLTATRLRRGALATLGRPVVVTIVYEH
jgi:hypothetical protein